MNVMKPYRFVVRIMFLECLGLNSTPHVFSRPLREARSLRAAERTLSRDGEKVGWTASRPRLMRHFLGSSTGVCTISPALAISCDSCSCVETLLFVAHDN